MNVIQSASEHLEVNTSVEDDDEDEGIKKQLKKQVSVLRAVNPGEIYVSFDEEKIMNRFSKMDVAMQEFYSAKKMENCALNVGEKCVAFVLEIKKYLRAHIISVDEDKKACKVLLIDTAEELSVPAQNIYILNDALKEYPSFAMKCHLSGISPAGDVKKWSNLANEYIQELFKNEKKIFITKSGPTSETNSLPVIMWYLEFIPGTPLEPATNKLHSINKLLVKNGLALKARELPRRRQECDIEQKIEDAVKVKYILARILPYGGAVIIQIQ